MKTRIGFLLLVLTFGFLTSCSYFRWGERSHAEVQEREREEKKAQQGFFNKPVGN